MVGVYSPELLVISSDVDAIESSTQQVVSQRDNGCVMCERPKLRNVVFEVRLMYRAARRQCMTPSVPSCDLSWKPTNTETDGICTEDRSLN